jgi:hypothetical protein
MTRWREMLDRAPGVALVLDRDLQIADVGWRNWTLFWEQNGGGPMTDLLGRDVTDFFSPGPVRDTFRHAFNAVATGQRPWVRLDFRCDSPDLSRMMRLTVTPLTLEGRLRGLLYHSVPLWAHRRDGPLPAYPPTEQICAVCNRTTPDDGSHPDRHFAAWDWTPRLPWARRPMQTLCPACHLDLLTEQHHA